MILNKETKINLYPGHPARIVHFPVCFQSLAIHGLALLIQNNLVAFSKDFVMILMAYFLFRSSSKGLTEWAPCKPHNNPFYWLGRLAYMLGGVSMIALRLNSHLQVGKGLMKTIALDLQVWWNYDQQVHLSYVLGDLAKASIVPIVSSDPMSSIVLQSTSFSLRLSSPSP